MPTRARTQNTKTFSTCQLFGKIIKIDILPICHIFKSKISRVTRDVLSALVVRLMRKSMEHFFKFFSLTFVFDINRKKNLHQNKAN